jgi:hypothetical protein
MKNYGIKHRHGVEKNGLQHRRGMDKNSAPEYLAGVDKRSKNPAEFNTELCDRGVASNNGFS